MRISLTSLRELPSGAEYSSKQGRTRVRVSVTGGDTLSVLAETDSVVGGHISYARFEHDKSGTGRLQEETVTNERRKPPSGFLLSASLAVCAAGLLLMLLSMYMLRK